MLLEVSGLTKTFKSLVAVNDLTFGVAKSEIVGIIGPNGAGKTTLIDLISGFHLPTSGKIWFRGEDITKLKPHLRVRKMVSRTFQTPRVFSKLNVWDNISIGCIDKARNGEEGPLPRDRDERCWELLKMLALRTKKDQIAGGLTHYELRKLEIGRALATGPNLVLLDEPFAGLSLEEVNSLMETTKTINQMGITILLVEHVMKALMNISNRVIVMVTGQKILEGPPTQVSKDAKVIDAYLGKGAKFYAGG